jgi:hypothetical protein
MSHHFSIYLAIGLLTVMPLGALRAADAPSPAEAHLREALRNTMLQLRSAETENATLQAAQAESATKEKDLSAKVAALTKQSAADKTAADKKIADLTAKAAVQETQITQFKEALAKWEAAYKQAVEVAASKEAERAKSADSCLKLDRVVADMKSKNSVLFKLGTEILGRYERFGLGTALTAKEPFVGITRVKLENLVQDYQDKLADQKNSQ